MTKTVDLTKVTLAPKSFAWLCIAFMLVLTAFGIGTWGSGKLREVIAGVTKGAAETAEEF